MSPKAKRSVIGQRRAVEAASVPAGGRKKVKETHKRRRSTSRSSNGSSRERPTSDGEEDASSDGGGRATTDADSLGDEGLTDGAQADTPSKSITLSPLKIRTRGGQAAPSSARALFTDTGNNVSQGHKKAKLVKPVLPDSDEEDEIARPNPIIDSDSDSDSDDQKDCEVDLTNELSGSESPEAAAAEDSSKSESSDDEDAPAVDFTRLQKTLAKSAASAAAASPTKARAWKSPVTNGMIASGNGGIISTSAKQFDVKALLVGDVGIAVNTGSRVARKYAILLDMKTDQKLILVGYAEDATKYMANLTTGRYYTLDLISRPNTPGKSLCLPDHKVFYKIAPNSKIRPYAASSALDARNLAEENEHSTIGGEVCQDIQDVAMANEGDLVSISGVVMSATPQTMKFSTGTKVVLADATGYVSIMFFEGKSNLTVGASLVIIGAKVWKNNRSGAKELSVFSTAVAATNVVAQSKALMAVARRQDYSGLSNVSAVPAHECRSMIEIRQEASGLENETDTVSFSVYLRLDEYKPAHNGTMTYNACIKCRKKIRRLEETDLDGNYYFDHDNENAGPSHKALTYESHYYFNGRFRHEADDDVYLAQVDDTLGTALFGMSADALTSMESDEEQQKAVKKGTSDTRKYNITVVKTGDIQSITLVE